jgi:hypothetical protein
MSRQLHRNMSDLIIGLPPLSADHSLRGVELAPYIFLLLPSLNKLCSSLHPYGAATACTSSPPTRDVLLRVHLLTSMDVVNRETQGFH